jgi:polysaccharide export outer membrane protein
MKLHCSKIRVEYATARPWGPRQPEIRLMTKFRPIAGYVVSWLLFLTLSALCRSGEVPTAADRQHIGLLGPGDAISIQVFGQPDVTNVYVAEDGTISVPLVGNIQVGGMTPVEAAARVAKALKDGGFYIDPHVTILVTTPRSQLVSVVGEVQASGRYPITPRTTIVDLLAQAGGVKQETASDVGYVLRSDESGHITRYPIKLNGLTDLKDALPTPTLLGGDSLVVPRAEHFYVTGEVTTPGKYNIEAPAESTSVAASTASSCGDWARTANIRSFMSNRET